MSNEKKVKDNRRLRYGGASLVTILAVVAVIVLVNVGVTALDNNWNLKLDVTANQMYEISPQTREIVENLAEPVQFIALFSEANVTSEVVELLNRYRALNRDMITVTVVDPIRNPTYATKFDPTSAGIGEGSVIVTAFGEERYRVVGFADMYEYGYDEQTYERYIRAFRGEQVLTNAMVFVSSPTQQRIFFASAHDEIPFSQYAAFMQSPLEQLNLEVGEVGLNLELNPDDMLVLHMPQRDISPEEREQIRIFLESGGKLFYMRNAGDPELTNLESLLESYGIIVEHDLVVDTDPGSNQLNEPTIIVPTMNAHPIVDNMRASGLMAVLPYCSSFSVSDVTVPGRTITEFLTTSGVSFSRVELDNGSPEMIDSDLPGPRAVGVAVEQEQSNGMTTKIVVLGNGMYIADQSTASFSGNGDLFFDSVRWMQGSTSAISVVGKSLVGNRLNIPTFTQFIILMVLVVLVIPIGIMAVGLVIWMRRRHS